MTVQNTTRSKTIAAVSISNDGAFVTYTIGARKLRRSFGSSDREIVRFLLGDARSGTVNALKASEIGGGHMLELTVGERRFTAALGTAERELEAFLLA